jgi:poly-gamma-glutamate system protein
MKKLYWRPSGVSRLALVLIAVVSVVCLVSVENLPRVRRLAHFADKLAAARLSQTGMTAIKEERIKRGDTFDPEIDPLGTGMLGNLVTPITSNTGHLPAKMISTNPNFAAVIVSMLRRAGVNSGDAVAVGISGSFPALNLSTYAALQTLQVKPLVITSVASSEWGATDPYYTWLDMERTLSERRLIGFRAIAASRGGIDDRGFGISKQGRRMLDAAIERSGAKRLEPESLEDAIATRMNTYYEAAGETPIRAYINIGGGSASVGTAVGKRLYEPGLNRSVPRGATDSVLSRFVQEGVPVIHISGIKEIATRYGLSTDPTVAVEPGEGGVYSRVEYNPWYAGMAMLVILGTMVAFLRLDFGRNLLGQSKASNK